MEKKRFGIQLSDGGDLTVRSGAIALGDTMAQNEYLLIVSQPGEIKEHPSVGAGMSDMVGGTSSSEAKRRIRESLRADGMTVRAIDMTDGGAIRRLEAAYE